MTVLESPGVAPPSAPARGGRRLSLPVLLLAIAGGLLVLAGVRVVTGANDITSSGAVRAALELSVPIGLAGLGGLWSERAGVVNIGLEGMMILGTWFGAWGAIHWGPWVGVVCGILGGVLGGVLHAVATVTFGVDHIVSGVAITILAGGLARYLSQLAFTKLPGGGVTQSPTVKELPRFSVPGVEPVLKKIEDSHAFLVSDVAGIVRGLLTHMSWLTLIAVVLIPLSWLLLWRTAFGLRLRSCGENPKASESLGVNVYLYKYVGVVASGAFAGLGGVFLSMVASNIYREGQVNGRGFIGLAAMIFGNWRPGGLAVGASLFGYIDAVQLRSTVSVHALLLVVAILLLASAAWQAYRRRWLAASFAGATGLGAGVWYLSSDTIAEEFVHFAPHLTTLVVLALAAQRLRPPAADGQPYRRGG